MNAKIQKFTNLSYTEKKLAFHTLITLLIVKCALKILPFKHVWAYYNRQTESAMNNTEHDNHHIMPLVYMVNGIADQLPNTLCLPRALALKTILAQRGYQCELHIGVKKTSNNRIIAHAWLERHNEVIIGDLEQLPMYARFENMDMVFNIAQF